MADKKKELLEKYGVTIVDDNHTNQNRDKKKGHPFLSVLAVGILCVCLVNCTNTADTDKKDEDIALASDYEPDNSNDSDMYAAINDFVLTAYGLTFQKIDGMTNYSTDVIHLFNNSSNHYGMEYDNNKNCTYIFRKTGADPCGNNDVCVGACGWFSRIMDFDHEWAAYISDLENSLRATYPDCTAVRFTSTSAIPDAPTNIGDTLAYMDFTVSFENAGTAKVRLYVEAKETSSIIGSDDWAMICLPDEF